MYLTFAGQLVDVPLVPEFNISPLFCSIFGTQTLRYMGK